MSGRNELRRAGIPGSAMWRRLRAAWQRLRSAMWRRVAEAAVAAETFAEGKLAVRSPEAAWERLKISACQRMNGADRGETAANGKTEQRNNADRWERMKAGVWEELKLKLMRSVPATAAAQRAAVDVLNGLATRTGMQAKPPERRHCRDSMADEDYRTVGSAGTETVILIQAARRHLRESAGQRKKLADEATGNHDRSLAAAEAFAAAEMQYRERRDEWARLKAAVLETRPENPYKLVEVVERTARQRSRAEAGIERAYLRLMQARARRGRTGQALDRIRGTEDQEKATRRELQKRHARAMADERVAEGNWEVLIHAVMRHEPEFRAATELLKDAIEEYTEDMLNTPWHDEDTENGLEKARERVKEVMRYEPDYRAAMELLNDAMNEYAENMRKTERNKEAAEQGMNRAKEKCEQLNPLGARQEAGPW